MFFVARSATYSTNYEEFEIIKGQIIDGNYEGEGKSEDGVVFTDMNL